MLKQFIVVMFEPTLVVMLQQAETPTHPQTAGVPAAPVVSMVQNVSWPDVAVHSVPVGHRPPLPCSRRPALTLPWREASVVIFVESTLVMLKQADPSGSRACPGARVGPVSIAEKTL